MQPLEIIVKGDSTQANVALQKTQQELGRTAIAAQKTDSSLAKMGGGISTAGAAAQKAASNIGNLAGTLISGGLITAVTVAGVALIELGKSLFDVSKEQQRFNEVLDGAKSSYVKAVLEVDKMRDAFDKARVGVISKKDALNLYNSTIGKTIGQTNDLDIAEKNFIANADNYIKYTFLKAAANIALTKAAEEAFKAELIRSKPTGEYKKFTDIFTDPITLKKKQLSEVNKEQNSYLQIYNKLKDQANALGFKGIDQSEKEIVVIKKKTEATRELIKVQRSQRSGLLPQNTGESAPLSSGTGATIQTDVIVKPTFKFIEADNEAFFKALEEFFDKERIKQLAEEFSTLVSTVVEDITESSLASLGDALGNALAGGKDVIPNLFGSLMNNVGQQVQELGKFLIKSAITVKVAKEAFQKLLANPLAAVAVGIGLIALGAILKQQASKQFQGFASGTTGVRQGGVYNVGERGPERIFLPAGAKVQPNNELNAYGGGGSNVFIPAVTLSGSDLVIAFNRASQQMNRNN